MRLSSHFRGDSRRMMHRLVRLARQILRVTPADARRGASLVTVLAFSIVTLSLGASILTAGSSESRNAHERLNSSQAFWIAEAGFQRFMAEEYNSTTWLNTHRTFSDTLNGGTYTLMIRDTTVTGLPSGTTPYHVISTGTMAGRNATASRTLDCLLSVKPGSSGINLGTASPANYTTLAMGPTDVTITGSSIIKGSVPNLGVPSGGTLSISGSSTVLGSVFADTGIAVSVTGSSSVGAVVQNSTTNAQLTQAAADAQSASDTYAALSATIATTSITGATTITGVAGQNVMNLTELNVNGSKTITISAPSTAWFIINVSGTFDINGSSSIKLSGGIKPSNVLWNVTGPGSLVLNGSSEFNGILLVPDRDVTLNGSSAFTGAVIAGGSSLDLKGSTSIIGCGAPTTFSGSATPTLATVHWAERGTN